MPINLHGLDALFRPASIALVGASADPAKIGGRPLRFLRENGYAGGVYPIHPSRTTIQGLRAHPRVSAVGEPIDLALIAVPKDAVIPVVTDCADAGVRAATIFSAGFAESAADGGAMQDELAAIAARSGMRILGPNCLGSASRRHGVSATFAAAEGAARPEGNAEGVALISQSGAVAGYAVLAGLDRSVTFDPWISTGNECDIQLADCIAYAALDDEVRVIAAYLEGCRDGDRLREALALAHERGKPVVLLKAGRSEAGSRAAASHTASLVGAEETYEALARQYNVCRAESLDDLIDLSYLLASGPLPKGPRTGIVTSSGGVGILMADVAADTGLEVPPLPERAQAALREIWPAAGVGNPIDTTAQLVNDSRLLVGFLHTVLDAGEFDQLVVFLSYIGLFPGWSQAAVDALRETRATHPHADITLAMLTSPEVRRSIEDLGIRVFADPTKAMRAVARGYRLAQRAALPAPPRPGVNPAPVRLTGKGLLSERESADLLEAAGLPVVDRRVVTSPEEAAEAARAFGGPVAMKIISADLPHKTDIGGVLLGVRTAEDAAAGFDRIMASARANAPAATLDGVLVAPMVTDGMETIIGVSNDPVFGPTVMFGLGGVLVEALRDVAFRLAPFSTAEAMAMISEIKAHELLRGVRGAPPRDITALAEALSTLSAFADRHRDEIESIDVNPFVVLPDGKGALALDALIELR